MQTFSLAAMMKKSASKAISQQEEGEPPGTLPSVSRKKTGIFRTISSIRRSSVDGN
jgi:hypothetical protein